ncbi:MAG: hypothetical protein COA69_01170 [Robiginitomaculum sp.]|nr:MAG: hypothetical protein COA69_01170 [Robiginitomaculum sp.]
MRAEDCAILVLASGSSKRFGPEDKLLTPFLGRPLCTHIIDTTVQINFMHRYVIVPENCPDRVAPFIQANFQIIINPKPEAGRGYALRLGAQALLAHSIKNMCVVLADMPLINTSHLHTLLERATGPVTMSAYNGIKMPPAIFANEALIQLSKPQTARKNLVENQQTVCVPLSGLAAQDIDTKTELRTLEDQFKL